MDTVRPPGFRARRPFSIHESALVDLEVYDHVVFPSTSSSAVDLDDDFVTRTEQFGTFRRLERHFIPPPDLIALIDENRKPALAVYILDISDAGILADRRGVYGSREKDSCGKNRNDLLKHNKKLLFTRSASGVEWLAATFFGHLYQKRPR